MKVLTVAGCPFLAACASSGVIPTGPDAYMISKTSAGGVFVSGTSVRADLYVEANKYCNDRGLVVDTVDATSKNAIPFARMPSAELQFKCVQRLSRPSPATAFGQANFSLGSAGGHRS